MQIPVMFSQIVPPLVRINQGIFISFDKFGEKNRTPSNIYSYLLDPAWVHGSNFSEYTIPCNHQAIPRYILKKYW